MVKIPRINFQPQLTRGVSPSRGGVRFGSQTAISESILNLGGAISEYAANAIQQDRQTRVTAYQDVVTEVDVMLHERITELRKQPDFDPGQAKDEVYNTLLEFRSQIPDDIYSSVGPAFDSLEKTYSKAIDAEGLRRHTYNVNNEYALQLLNAEFNFSREIKDYYDSLSFTDEPNWDVFYDKARGLTVSNSNIPASQRALNGAMAQNKLTVLVDSYKQQFDRFKEAEQTKAEADEQKTLAFIMEQQVTRDTSLTAAEKRRQAKVGQAIDRIFVDLEAVDFSTLTEGQVAEEAERAYELAASLGDDIAIETANQLIATKINAINLQVRNRDTIQRKEDLDITIQTGVTNISLGVADGLTEAQVNASYDELIKQTEGYETPNQRAMAVNEIETLRSQSLARVSVLKQKQWTPFFNELDVLVAENENKLPKDQIGRIIQYAAVNYSAEQDLSYEEQINFNNLVSSVHSSYITNAIDVENARTFTEAQRAIQNAGTVALSQVNQGEDADTIMSAFAESVGLVMEGKDELMQRDLDVVISGVETSINAELSAEAKKAQDVQTYTQLQTSITRGVGKVQSRPQNTYDVYVDTLVEINESDLSYAQKQELKNVADHQFAIAHIRGSVDQAYRNPAILNDLEAQTKLRIEVGTNSLVGSALGNEFEGIYQQAVTRAEQEVRKTSATAADNFISEKLLRGEASSEEIAHYINNSPLLTTEDKARINNTWVKLNEEQIRIADIGGRLNNPNHVHSRDEENDLVDWLNNQNKPVRELLPELMLISDKAGFIPSAYGREMISIINNGTTEQVSEVLDTMIQLENNDRAALSSSLSNEEWRTYVHYRNAVRFQPDQAASGAIQSVRDRLTDPNASSLFAQRNTAFNLELAEDDDFTSLTELRSYLDVEDSSINSEGNKYLLQDMRDASRYFFQNGMNFKEAKKAAATAVLKDWGSNADGKPMYLSPEVTGLKKYRSPDSRDPSHSWVWNQLSREVESNREEFESEVSPFADPITLDLDNVRLMADEMTLGQINRGESPSWAIRFTNEFGVVDFLRNREGVVARFTPEPDQEVIDGHNQVIMEEAVGTVDISNEVFDVRNTPEARPIRIYRRPEALPTGPGRRVP